MWDEEAKCLVDGRMQVQGLCIRPLHCPIPTGTNNREYLNPLVGRREKGGKEDEIRDAERECLCSFLFAFMGNKPW